MITLTILVRLVVYSLAVWRLSLLLNSENGPYHVFDWLRHKAGIEVTRFTYTDTAGTVVYVDERTPTNELAEMINCMRCLMFWVSAALFPWLLLAWPYMDGFVVLIALWGLATLYNFPVKDGIHESVNNWR